MSGEVFEIIQRMDQKNIETQLALQCAPLITGIKISNLLIIPKENEKYVRAILKSTPITFYRLLTTEEKTTFLLFRRSQLEHFLEKTEVREFFLLKGYRTEKLGVILSHFSQRYRAYMNGCPGFPHEMGLLLGYPVEDVLGFIENEGKNYLYAGYWKVYADMAEKIRLFKSYESARETLLQMISSGVCIADIIRSYSSKTLLQTAV